MDPTRRGVLAAAGGVVMTGPARGAEMPWPVGSEITLGALFPLSGVLSLAGDECLRGLELAVAEQNRLGGVRGRRLRLVSADLGGSGDPAAAVRGLIADAHASVLFGTTADALSLAATAAAEVAGVPYFELCATADAITARGFHGLFRTCPTAEAIAALVVDAVGGLIAPALHLRAAALRPAILHLDEPGPAAMAALQVARCRALGLDLSAVVAYSAATADFGVVVQRLREAGAEVVLHGGFVNDTLILFRAMRRVGWRPAAVIGATDAYASADTEVAIGPAFDGAFAAGFTPYDVSPAAAPEAAEVARLYARAWGMAPRSGLSLACFTGARVAFAAMAAAHSLAPAELRRAVLATGFPPGSLPAGWGVAFGASGQNLLATPVLSQWQRRRLLAVWPGAIAKTRARLR